MTVLTIEHLRKEYVAPDGERSVVLDVPAFTVAPGQHIALHGASGCGKTTFLNCIAGIQQADAGRIVVAGQDIAHMSESARDRHRARHVGYVFQTFNLLQGYTALENVLLGSIFAGGADDAHARELLERLGLAQRLDYRPRQLSVGQQQRVAVARALASHPELVLADEPTGNLDHHHASEAIRLIRAVCEEKGAALLVVSHDREIIGQFDDAYEFAAINRAAADGSAPGADRA